ncbi:hypothetical protein SAMN05444745_12012 [Arthrobacter sp. OV608]|nr:hypothetical protein SAMN05444745_12012 [Arthrobacter sp. OV608]
MARSQTTYLAAKYRRVKSRRGPMKALVAVEHSVLIAIWHMLTTDECYADPGPDYCTRRQPLRSKETTRNTQLDGHPRPLQPTC